jgi:RHS repeat-associated protein
VVLLGLLSHGPIAQARSYAYSGLVLSRDNGHKSVAPSWARWGEEPSTLTLRINANVKADTGIPFTIAVGSLSVSNVGLNCSTYTNAPELSVPVHPNEPFFLTVSGSKVYGVEMVLTVPASLDLTASRMIPDTRQARLRGLDSGSGSFPFQTSRNLGGRPATPPRHAVLVDGVEGYSVGHTNTNSTCSAYTNTWTIEVQTDPNAARRNGLRSMANDVPENEAPGDGEWPDIGPGKSFSPNITPIKWSVGVGRLQSGKSAGRIHYRESGLNANSFTRAALVFDQPLTNQNQVIVLKDSVGLRQIRAPQTLVDVASVSTNAFDVRFYLLSQVSTNINPGTGYYDILSNAPPVVWRFTNATPESGQWRKLRVTEDRRGTNYITDVEYDPTNKVWSLTRGAGADLVREVRSVILQTNDAIHLRIETNRVSDTSGNVLYQAVETYQEFPLSWELIAVVTDPGGLAYTNTFEYDTNYWDCVARPVRIVYPDGSWETRSYAPYTYGFGNYGPVLLDTIVKPYKDIGADDSSDPQNLVQQYHYVVNLNTLEVCSANTSRKTSGKTYRYDTTKKDEGGGPEFFNGLHRDTYQMGGEPSCGVARAREGALYYPDDAAAHVAGQTALSVTNYTLGATNTYDTGTWSGSTFTPGTGPDWRKTTIRGFGTLFDAEAPSVDRLDIIPGKSTKEYEIRQGGVVVHREFYIYTDAVTNGSNFERVFRDYYTNDSLGHLIGIARVDEATQVARTLRTADWRGTNQFPGSLLLSETDEDGVTFRYTYDSLKRLKTRTLAGTNGLPDYVVTSTYDAQGRTLSVTTNAGSLSLANKFQYDPLGRMIRHTNHEGFVTVYAYPSNGLSTSITYPGGATRVSTRFLSGEPKSETGTALVPQYFDHEYYETIPPDGWVDGLIKQRHSNAVSRTTYVAVPDSARQRTVYYNLWNSPIREVSPGLYGSVTNKWYFYANWDEDVTSTEVPGTDPDRPIQQYSAYDWEHIPSASWLYVNGAHGHTVSNLAPYPWSQDRLTTTETRYVKTNGAWFRFSTTSTYLTDDSANATFGSETRQRLNGLASGVKAETITYDADTNSTTTTTYVDRTARKVTQKLVSVQSTLAASNVVINGLLQSESTLTVAGPTRYTYDALRRPIQVISPAGAVTTTTYDTATGRVLSTTDFAGNTTSYEYYPDTHTNAGRIKCVTAANGKKTYYEYTARGELWRTWGDVPYPEERIYDQYGDLVELRTFRGGSGWNGSSWPASPGSADITRWNYDGASGLLLSKQDHLNNTVSYGYYTNKTLRRRTWARGVSVTNIYTAGASTGLGDLYRLAYSDGTPSVTLTNYNRAGQPRTILDVAGERSLLYDHAGRPVADIGVSGLFAGVTVTNHFHPTYGRDALEVKTTAPLLHYDYGYDTYGRLSTVTAGNQSATYAYLPNADQLQSTTLKNGATTVLTTTRGWEYGVRMQSVQNVVGTSCVSSHSYIYDAVHRRTQAALADGSRWQYAYNDRNEVISGDRFWNDWGPVSGQQFDYAYDNIGNRTSAASGGDVNGANQRTTTYAANALNQYTSITTPGYKDIVGVAIATNSVTVNSGATDRKVEYFHREISIANGSAPVWQSVTVTSGSSNSSGGLVFPKNVQSLSYDIDGNLTFDGVWAYRWDGENRLVEMAMTNVTSVPNAQRTRLQFTYDYLGRRVQKVVHTWNGSQFATLQATNRCVYDLSAGQAGGWNLLAELERNGKLVRSYVWGLDLSGTMDEAGGVGGLLVVGDYSWSGGTTNGYHFAAYDGNGNITALLGTNASVTARYEYGPFAEPIRVSGAFARINPFRWSTKYTDEESGLVYYGYRFPSATIGRWISRDPIGEEGGGNLYVWIQNSCINFIDPDGRFLIDFFKDHPKLTKKILGAWIAARVLAPGSGLPDIGRPMQQQQARMEQVQDIRRSRAKGVSRGAGSAAAIALGFTITWAESMYRSMAAMENVLAGVESDSEVQRNLESFFRNAATGDTAFADLDAITAAVEMTGGSASDALIAWATFDIAGELFAEAVNR